MADLGQNRYFIPAIIIPINVVLKTLFRPILNMIFKCHQQKLNIKYFIIFVKIWIDLSGKELFHKAF